MVVRDKQLTVASLAVSERVDVAEGSGVNFTVALSRALGHDGALGESRGFSSFRLGSGRTALLVQHHAVAGQQPCTCGVWTNS